MKFYLLGILLVFSAGGFTQALPFPQMGQAPDNAFPICGIDTFRQLSVPYGSQKNLNINGCGSVQVINPYYYSFTSYTNGKMALLINPVFTDQDYNWELFDITGHNANEIYDLPSLAVIGNWSGVYGRTGARSGGANYTACVSDANSGDPTFSEMPDLLAGHQYLLLVCGYTSNQGGYQLAFAGTTADITDGAPSRLKSVFTGCNQKIISVVMNKQMRCYSLASDGSDFSLNTDLAVITGATGKECSTQFDFDTLRLTLSDRLPPGNYTLMMKNGADNNTVMDNCGNLIPEGDNISFTVTSAEQVSAAFNYDISKGCTYDTIFLHYPFSGNLSHWQWIIDSSVLTDPEPVFITSVFDSFDIIHVVSNATCTDSVIKRIELDNAIRADFNSPGWICPKEEVTFENSSTGKVKTWYWDFGDGTFSDQQDPSPHVFPDTRTEDNYHVSLIVQNEAGCTDTAYNVITKRQSCFINVPNAFTPNGDGKNDYLYPVNLPLTTHFKFSVYNRYGQRIFETEDAAKKWDGSFHGVAQAYGTYVWILSYAEEITGKSYFLQGTTVLIR